MLTLNDLTRFDFSELKHCTTAGEPMQTETIRIWKESTGLTIREAYGQTETVCMIGNFRGFKVKPGSMGKPAPGWRIEIHDEDGANRFRPEKTAASRSGWTRPRSGFLKSTCTMNRKTKPAS